MVKLNNIRDHVKGAKRTDWKDYNEGNKEHK